VLLAADAAAATAKLRQLQPSLTLALQALGLAGDSSEAQGPGPGVMRMGWDAVDPLRTDGSLNRACREGARGACLTAQFWSARVSQAAPTEGLSGSSGSPAPATKPGQN
jgi:hypothetical protein